MKAWEKVRNLWLAAAFVSSSLVLLKLVVTPKQDPPQPSYTFPASIPLSRWQFVQAIPIGVQKYYTPSLATSTDDLTISGQRYRYLRNGKTLEIEMRYFVAATDVSDILRETTVRLERIDFASATSSVGNYGIYQQSDQLHIVACIPPTRQTTVTDGELRGAQNRPNLLVQRALPWFLGQAPLRDLRCLWTKASMPIHSASIAVTQQELEQTWLEWVQWWQNNYPPE